MEPVFLKKIKAGRIISLFFMVMGIFLFHSPLLYAGTEDVIPVVQEELLPQDTPEVPVIPSVVIESLAPITDARPALLGKFLFENDQISSAPVHPSSDNYSTSIILYVSNGDDPETWTYEPETLGFGDFNFSDYFYLGSPVGKYLLVEYQNDDQTFSCYGMFWSDCIANPHFISQFSFKVNEPLPPLAVETIQDPLPIISAVTDPLSDDSAMITTVDIDSASIVETPVEVPESVEAPERDVPADSPENTSQQDSSILTDPAQPVEVDANQDVVPLPIVPDENMVPADPEP